VRRFFLFNALPAFILIIANVLFRIAASEAHHGMTFSERLNSIFNPGFFTMTEQFIERREFPLAIRPGAICITSGDGN
jgi:uncharacterized membrane-anchored protein